MRTFQPKPVIYDGDMAGNDIISLMMLHAYPEYFDVKGITTVFGVVDCKQATQNALNFLDHFNIPSIPVSKGADNPLRCPLISGHSIYGKNGLGDVFLHAKGRQAIKQDAPAFIIDTVMQSPRPVTIFGTGPCTNIANALLAKPEISANIEQIILTGGGLQPGPDPDMAGRSGDITLHAEFNFFSDPDAANAVLTSRAATKLITLDATQRICLNAPIRNMFLHVTSRNIGTMAVKMIAPSDSTDRSKFGADGPFLHDPHAVIYGLYPYHYKGENAYTYVEHHEMENVSLEAMRRGKLHATWDKGAKAQIITDIVRPDLVAADMSKALGRFAQRHMF